jgi:STE24 endopeptidase
MFGILQTGLSSKIRDWSERVTHFKFLQVCLYAITFLFLTTLITFPFSLYTDFFREHEYGLLNQNFGEWMSDELKGMLIGFVLGVPGTAVLYACVRKFPKTYHTWATALSIVFVAFIMLIGPVFIDPLFNQYKPLENGPVRDKLLSMARSNGIAANEIFQFDASKQSDRISANVSGFAGTVAIRLNDNLLRRTTPPEILSVAGHEMGHYCLNHGYKLLSEFAVIFFFLFTIIRWSFEKMMNGIGARWSIRSAGDVAGLPLVVGLLTIYSFLLTPVFNSVVRTSEAEADLFGLNTAREPDADAEIDLKLTEYRKPDPAPIEEFVFFDHPSARNRILMAMRWKAENLPLK